MSILSYQQSLEATNNALRDPIWLSHKIGDRYTMDGESGWKIVYFPLVEDGKSGEAYSEARALVELPKKFKDKWGIDFREVPLRFLSRSPKSVQTIYS